MGHHYRRLTMGAEFTGTFIPDPPSDWSAPARTYWWDVLPVGAVLEDYDTDGNAVFVGPSGTRWRVDPWDDTITALHPLQEDLFS
jgi:hypothetical protein